MKVSTGALEMVMTDDKDQSCGICLQDMSPHEALELECRHRFHPKCIVEWFRRRNSLGRCPMCRDAPDPAAPSGDEESLPDLEDVATLWAGARVTYSISQAQAHRILAPMVYGPRRKDASTRPLVDRYMACRRRLRVMRRDSAIDSLASRRLQRDYSHASQVLLTCWAFEDMFPFVVSSI